MALVPSVSGKGPAAGSGAPNSIGIVAADNSDRFNAPADPTGAIGENHYVEAVNDRIAVYTRKGLQLRSAASNNDFWRVPFLAVGDPQIAWDAEERRWYASVHVPQRDQLLFAWSKSADPTDLKRGWCRFAVPGRRLLPDFPMLGFSRNHIVIGVNMGNEAHEKLLFSRIWAIAKPPAGSTACRRPAMSAFGSQRSPLRQADGLLAFTPIPAKPVHPSESGYVIASDCIDDGPGEVGEEGCGRLDHRGSQITVWHVTGTPESPRLIRDGAIEIPTYALPEPVGQPGTKGRLDASDTRLTQAVSNRDPSLGVEEAIWTQHTVAGADGRSEIHWYEIDPRSLAVLRSGTVASPRHSVLYGAISPTSRGDSAAINYLVASRTLRVQLRARSRRAGDRPGLMGSEILLGRSRGSVERCGGICRLGDYAAASPDPRRANLVWGSNQVIGRSNPRHPTYSTWRTRNFAITVGRGAFLPHGGK